MTIAPRSLIIGPDPGHIVEKEKTLTLYEQVWEYPFRKMQESHEDSTVAQSNELQSTTDGREPLPKFEYHAVFSLCRRP